MLGDTWGFGLIRPPTRGMPCSTNVLDDMLDGVLDGMLDDLIGCMHMLDGMLDVILNDMLSHRS